MHIFGELLAPQYLQWLWNGFLLTIGISLCVCFVATFAGLVLCVLRMEGRGIVSWLVTAFLTLFRNTPLLVQLFFWYFAASAFLTDDMMTWLNTPHAISIVGVSVRWPSFEFIAGFFGLTLYTTAFIAEEFRAGVLGVPVGQKLAAAALGFKKWQTWWTIVLPQAVRHAFSPLVGQYMNAVKNSSLTMAIGLAELSYASRQVETQTFKTFQAFGFATLLYVALIVVMELAAQGVIRSRKFQYQEGIRR